jgi:hypothetical protein
MSNFVPQLCIDFDGVIHSYSKGWQGGEIYDGPTDGFFPWAAAAKHKFKLVVYSSRSKTPEGIAAMRDWFARHIDALTTACEISIDDFEFAHEKPPAWLTIDDRAICFDGDWSKLDPQTLLEFKPWCAPSK